MLKIVMATAFLAAATTMVSANEPDYVMVRFPGVEMRINAHLLSPVSIEKRWDAVDFFDKSVVSESFGSAKTVTLIAQP